GDSATTIAVTAALGAGAFGVLSAVVWPLLVRPQAPDGLAMRVRVLRRAGDHASPLSTCGFTLAILAFAKFLRQ
ncbi:hypothetical protein AB0P32_35270, partial [Streptomyces sp. NPDC085995]|uniref:hypothetical protein n=1 Tax=Streptomyces sp. NPDC085995 TaxID=3154861 RepID=UPI003412B55C